jgi:uncharacterized membrane protein YccC
VTQPVETTSGRAPRSSNAPGSATSKARPWQRFARLYDWMPRDPGLVALRRAGRAAIVMPVAFAFALAVIRDSQAVTFVAFGCFALLVMADFGGPRRPRATAYVTTTLVGAALIALGTLASFSPWVAAIAMLLVGFVVQFAGVFGGYVAAAQTALLLAFVLAASVPVAPAAVAPRVAGWCLAGAVSTLAGVFLWPRFERSALRLQAAAACQALASMVRAERVRPAPPDLAQMRQTAIEAVEAARRAYAATPKRPAGPAQRDRAFVALLSEQERTLAFATRESPWRLSAQHPCLIEGDALAAAVAQTLEASGDVLGDGAPPDLAHLQATRTAHRAALDRWAADALQAGNAPEEVLAGLEADDALRVMAAQTLVLGADALIATGRQIDPALHLPLGIPLEAGSRAMARRIAQTVRIYLHPTSSVLHNSLRVAVGLALAVLLGGLLQLQHAFWVVLGTMSALRSSALATGRSTLQALGGTVIGIAIGAPFVWAVGTASTVLWALLPVVVFPAAYAASAVGFVAGQAAFTVVVIVLFNLIAPVGWRVGLVRIEDVAIGVGISLVAGVLLWPRGLRGELRRELANLYRAIAGELDVAFGQLLGTGTSATAFDAARSVALRSGERVGEAFDQYLRERGSQPIPPQVAAALGAAGRNVMLGADQVHAMAEKGHHLQGHEDPDLALLGQVQAVVDAFARLADELDRGASGSGNGEPVADDAIVRATVLGYLRRWKDDPAAEQEAVAAVTAGEWIRDLAALVADQEQRVAKVVEAAQVPWWR